MLRLPAVTGGKTKCVAKEFKNQDGNPTGMTSYHKPLP